MGCRSRDRPRIEAGAGEGCARAGAVEARVAVGGILGGLPSGLGDDGGKIGPAEGEQRAQEKGAVGAERPGGADAGEACEPGAPGKAHEERLGLVVGVVRSHQRRDGMRPAPGAQRGVARLARPLLEAALRRGIGRVKAQDRRREAERPRPLGDHGRLGGGLGPEPVIDRKHGQPAAEGAGGKPQERKRVRTPRDRGGKRRRGPERWPGKAPDLGGEVLGARAGGAAQAGHRACWRVEAASAAKLPVSRSGKAVRSWSSVWQAGWRWFMARSARASQSRLLWARSPRGQFW